ncbi:MAG: response regulator transcription factor [Flavobacteriales bacterium]|nr:response regulator transcription factor [Flavobacteriales bacterium]
MKGKILIGLNHEICSTTLCEYLNNRSPNLKIDRLPTGTDIIPVLNQKNYDLLILGMCSSGFKGLEMVRRLRREKVSIPILGYSIYPEQLYGLRLIKAGLNAFISADNNIDEFCSALRKLLDGGRYLTPKQTDTMARIALEDTAFSGLESLSEREFEVLILIAEGKTMNEIGTELSISGHTASSYRSRILKKLSLNNNIELALFAFRNGLV